MKQNNNKKTTESEIETLLKSNGYDVTSVNLTKIDDKNFIEIFLNDTGINDDSEHINSIENAKNLIKERLYLEVWEVNVVYANKES